MNNTNLPKFKYHPNVYECGIVQYKKGKCNCCNKTIDAYVELMYTMENVDCICMNCVASGRAAEKFNGTFIQDADKIENKEAIDELFNRTPGYVSWQGEHWAACCDDYCEYIGTVGTKELEDMGIADCFFEEDGSYDGYDDARNLLVKDGSLCGYLFRCLHCKKYYLRIDCD